MLSLLTVSTLATLAFAQVNTYGPQILDTGALSQLQVRSVSLTGVDSGWGANGPYAYADWLGPSYGSSNKVAWQNEDSADPAASSVVFIYNVSVPEVQFNVTTPNPNAPIGASSYSTAMVSYKKVESTEEARGKTLSKRDLWDGPFVQIPYSSWQIIAQQDPGCPTSQTLNVTVVDAAGTTNITTGGTITYSIPATMVWPLDIVITTDPDIGSVAATWQFESPFQYAIGAGADAPGIYSYSEINAYFCVQPEDD
ncbi:hypothetical protein DFH07DRAFT_240211 [Mycena maculata]|uniref:Uncharacterized protein n=1 Tax=Mycena maculata TaxID=230809 RepID=A0AAD7NQQ0_9AGAR|nr:hypothetical protein DFH07DRAFT_240211 [Mycena maculata]